MLCALLLQALLPALLAIPASQGGGKAAQVVHPPGRPVVLEAVEGKVIVRFGTDLFTEYRYADAAFPYFYPVLGAGDVPLTRAFPMEERPGEERDHPHHRSLWFAHGSVGGYDFWQGKQHGERIVQEALLQLESGATVGRLAVRNRWEADGKAVAYEERRLAFFERDKQRVLDFELVLRPAEGELVLGDTKEGSFAIRMATPLQLGGAGALGHARNSEGVRDRDCWGKRARWIDYWAPFEGRVEGVLMLDHPANFAHPTWWHARDYGLCAANPFGVHDFEGAPEHTGDRVLREGESLRLRYRVVFHDGELTPEAAEAFAAEYAREGRD